MMSLRQLKSALLLAAAFLLVGLDVADAFSVESSRSAMTASKSPPPQKQQQQPVGGILILDHLNINHEKGRHDWLKAFYFDFLQLAVDPRKEENLQAGQKTLWANAGANQFHLPEGKPDAQVLDGLVTLVYPDLQDLLDRQDNARQKLQGSKFDIILKQSDGEENQILLVTDPWGSQFSLVQGSEDDRDSRGCQPGDSSACLGMRDLTIYVPSNCNLEGISRFYNTMFQAPTLTLDSKTCVVSVGPRQTLTFKEHPESSLVSHTDLKDDEVEPPEGCPTFLSNYGPHISMYISNFPATYNRALELDVTYVNPRFKRRAYNLEEAIDDCMFRCLNIIDPENKDGGVILQLEHEVRSVVKRDGSLYKSCPFDQVPIL